MLYVAVHIYIYIFSLVGVCGVNYRLAAMTVEACKLHVAFSIRQAIRNSDFLCNSFDFCFFGVRTREASFSTTVCVSSLLTRLWFLLRSNFASCAFLLQDECRCLHGIFSSSERFVSRLKFAEMKQCGNVNSECAFRFTAHLDYSVSWQPEESSHNKGLDHDQVHAN